MEELDSTSLAILLVLVPLAIGWNLGTWLRVTRARALARPAFAALVAAALALAAPFVLMATLRVGLRDGAMIGLWLGVATAAGRAGFGESARGVLVFALATALALVLAEGLVRVALPRAPLSPPAETALVRIPPIDLDRLRPAPEQRVHRHYEALDECGYVHPDRYPAYLADRVKGAPHATSVLFVGDSMTMGLGVALDQAFPAVIGRAIPGVGMVNAAFPGTSIDYDATLLEPWLASIPGRTALVVVGVFFNDPLEIDYADACCADEPLLAYDAAGAHVRCPTPRYRPGFGQSLAWFWEYSPSPYPLRVLGERSSFAAWLRARLEPPRYLRRNDVHMKEHFAAAYALLRDTAARRGVPIVVVAVPYRALLRGDDVPPFEVAADRLVRDAAREAGLPVLDAFDHFRALVAREGDAPFFLGERDFHMSARGHEEMAAWLAPELSARLGAGEPATP